MQIPNLNNTNDFENLSIAEQFRIKEVRSHNYSHLEAMNDIAKLAFMEELRIVFLYMRSE